MQALHLLTFTCLVVAALAQTCPDTDITFLFDQSENALTASTNNPSNLDTRFDILVDQFTNAMRNSRIVNTPSTNTIRIGAYGYSGSGAVATVIPQGSSPATAISSIRQGLLVSSNSGSWTYRGLQGITSGPSYTNNVLILVSSQGSNNLNRRLLAQQEAQRVRSLGWDIKVIAAQGKNPVDFQELIIVNNNQFPIVINDTTSTDDPKSYRLLRTELDNIINSLCNAYPTTTTTTTTSTTTPVTTTTRTSTTTSTTTTTTTTPRPIVTRPPNSICSECTFDSGYGFDSDPMYCDTFFHCLPDYTPIKKMCPSGTFWDGVQCNFIDKVRCPSAVCNANTPANTRYPSGRCCNKYYECSSGKLYEVNCPVGQVFDNTTKNCQVVADIRTTCQLSNRYECEVNRNGPINTTDCSGYAPDPYGNPCKYQFNGYSLKVAPGTRWIQEKCTLDYTTKDTGYTTGGTSDRDFSGTVPANNCSAVFVANFNGGSRVVYSERLDANLDVYSILNEAYLANNALVFNATMVKPLLYYYFFNNRELRSNTAFKVTFRLDNPVLAREYDILSNNYCSQCPDTIRLTVAATDARRHVVTATFVTSDGKIVQSSAIIDKNNPSDNLEVRIIFGNVALYGQVSAVSSTNPLVVSQTVNFTRVDKAEGTSIAINRCGIQLGKGPNAHFVGYIDDFSMYENCADINTLLR
ncbi:unnamed protein product [Lymnaea stagnalis]|uniref:Chitin-binding type-2 domain-containing protein n=1 Tax=Lymnaea stagnalis TaxID=6523 RepID=A0AAV2HQQ1_LYMST